MATVQSLTKARMEAIEDASVVSGEIDGDGHLILTTHGGTDIDAGPVVGSVPDASETVKGVVELATTAEATAGVDTTRAITAAGLAAAVGNLVPDATETAKGKVELATTAETTTGTDTTRAVTPAGVAAAIVAFPVASTTVQGKVELATTVEAAAGTDTDRAVTPAGLLAMLAAHVYPVGAIYIATVATDPGTLLGFGTWTPIQGRFLVAENGARPAGTTGGAVSVTLATGNLPSHNHGAGTFVADSNGTHTHSIGRDQDGATGSAERVLHSTGISGADQVFSGQLTSDGAHTHSISGTSGSTGSGTAFSILPLYLSVYMWERTA